MSLHSSVLNYYLISVTCHTQHFNLIMQVPHTDNFHSSVHEIVYLSMNEDSYEKHLKGVAGDFSLCVLQTAA